MLLSILGLCYTSSQTNTMNTSTKIEASSEKPAKNNKHTQKILQPKLHCKNLSSFSIQVMALDWLPQPFLLIFFLIFILQSTTTSSISESEALIKLKQSFTNASALSSWVPGSSPCKGDTQWNGLLCTNGIVVGLRLENMGLSGKINVDALADISGLRTLSFARNFFSGSIPELNRLGYLKNIYLTGNQFSGEIPSSFFLKMQSLKKVWLSDNKFSGEIPSSLMHLTNLMELRIENNQFNGIIPYINHTKLTTFNVSNNKLEGPIPDGLTKFSMNSFHGNAGLCGPKLGKECRSTIDASTPNFNELAAAPDSAKKTSAGFIVLAAMLLSVAVVVVLKLRRKEDEYEAGGNLNGNAGEEVEEVEVQVSMPVRRSEISLTKKAGSSHNAFSSNNGKGGTEELVVLNDERGVFGLADLMKASAEVLGNGGLGSSYKALITNGTTVVVKRLREMNVLTKNGFDAEISKLGRLRHANILPPLAFHYRKEEKLLIYEYIPKGSLRYLLHGNKGPSHTGLNWPNRLKIVQGIAKGLGYLHTELAFSDLPHGNLKSSNVLLNAANEPLITEFGFYPLINPSAAGQALFACKAPEAAEFGVSPKCDVFCLGVIILEILTGKYPQYFSSGNGGIDLVQWVESTIREGKESNLLDPELASSSKSVGEMKRLLIIGALCTESNPVERLDLREAIKRIEEIKLESEVGDANKGIHELPSLKDGYTDAPPRFNPSTSTREGNGGNFRREPSRSFAESEQVSFASPASTEFLSDDK